MKNSLLELAMMSLIKLLTFLLFNRLFYCLFNYEVSRFFRAYSFKIFFLEVLFLEDIQKIVFILIRNFFVLFRVQGSPQYYAITIVPVLLGAFILLCFITLYPFQRYLHGKLSKYFLTNMFRIRGSLPLTFLLFCVKPLLTSSVQATCYKLPSLQLGLLALIELLSLSLMWIY